MNINEGDFVKLSDSMILFYRTFRNVSDEDNLTRITFLVVETYKEMDELDALCPNGTIMRFADYDVQKV